ncbi:hypothetical protein V8G54_007413 [Vigna mungo]|uniref:Uncharacterized protein n=1 Tax=Vigna mungo TaxID=3915 RepID=A0AAQ3P3C2_VIGMU
MGLVDILCSSRFLFTLVEATSRSGAMWPLKLEMESTVTIGWTVFSSSIFMFVALVLSTYLIFQHLAAYNQPEEQKFLIGLILMVPVYALESFLSLLDSSAAFNCEVIRDCYEAFALYCFERYLIACLGVAVAFLFYMGAFKGSLAQELTTRIQDYIICIEMGVAAVVHLYVFSAVPYKRGERCVRDVSVMADYASLGTPPDPAEVQDSERSTRMHLGRHDDIERRMKFTHNVRDVVFGSGEIIVDDMKFTVSRVAEPVERGIAKLSKAFHQISENVKRHEEERRRNTKVKDDSYVVPLLSWRPEFSDVDDTFVEGSVSDSGFPSRKRQYLPSKASVS